MGLQGGPNIRQDGRRSALLRRRPPRRARNPTRHRSRIFQHAHIGGDEGSRAVHPQLAGAEPLHLGVGVVDNAALQ
jgi:hypothetical protein